ncbi:MAG: hypothetical protein AB1806_13870 [Acidobacteriota bacterium]
MLPRRIAALLLCAACVPGLPPRAAATLVATLDLDELVARADLIAIGRVAHTIELRAATGGVGTEVALGACTLLKGTARCPVTFAVPGGRSGRYRTVVAGAPILREGDEIVVFLRDQSPRRSTLVGFSQGLIRVSRHPVTSEALVMAPPSASPVDRRVVRGDPGRKPVPLAALAREIQGVVWRDRTSDERRRGSDRRSGKQVGAGW